MQTPDDPLHQVNLGLWVHLLECIIVDIRNTLQGVKIRKGEQEVRVISDDALEGVWARLRRRMEDLHKDTTGFDLSDKVVTFATEMASRLNAKKAKTCVIDGREHHQLMLVTICPNLHIFFDFWTILCNSVKILTVLYKFGRFYPLR